MERRKFLKNLLPASAIFPSLLNGFTVKAYGAGFFEALTGAADNDHVLVLIQLSGGNDGLNTLVPISNYGDYNNVRTNIAIPQDKILRLDNYEKAGLHPSMTGMQKLYNEEKLGVLTSVGYPSPNQSHFRSTDIWLTGADENQYLNTGWTGRFLANTYSNYPIGYPNAEMPDPLAIQIGSVLSPVFMGPGGFTAMAVPTDTDFYNLINGIADPAPDSPMGTELTYLRAIARQTNKYADAIINAAKKVTNQSTYPANNYLAAQLKTVARLIGGGLKTRVYMVSMGGFDTHGGQVQAGNTIAGNHAGLLKQLSDAITAFQTDLAGLGASKRVMGMTFSEFGRRIKSNGSAGTDHGAAQPVFVFGDYIKQGVLGNPPDLSSQIGVEDSLPMQYDFRSVYSSILRDWFCVDPNDITTMLFKNYQYLPFIQGTACKVINPDVLGFNLITNYPNPFDQSTTITFKTNGGHTLIQIFDTAGRLIAVPIDKNYDGPGEYTITFYAGQLAGGVYYGRLQNGSTQQVRTMLKIRSGH
ncbi:MAG: DUF1501 domain-containing protein [Bacteroidetes bacterium]|nr:DUF1501 domain-containing protein [Bacteroidota bacterium]